MRGRRAARTSRVREKCEVWGIEVFCGAWPTPVRSGWQWHFDLFVTSRHVIGHAACEALMHAHVHVHVYSISIGEIWL
jgi:hypothetical protein